MVESHRADTRADIRTATTFGGGATDVELMTNNDKRAKGEDVEQLGLHQGTPPKLPLGRARGAFTSTVHWRRRTPRLNRDLLYRSSAERLLTHSISSWFGDSTALQSHNLNRIMRTAEKIIGVLLPHLQDFNTKLCIHKAVGILKDPTQPSHGRFTLRKNYRSMKDCSTAYCQSAQNKLKYLSLLIFNSSICLNPVLTYLPVYCCFHQQCQKIHLHRCS